MRFSINALLFPCLVLVLAKGLTADPWKIDLNANLTTTINSYSDNWTGGEAGSFTWGSQMLSVAEKQINKSLNTKTTLKLQFGQTALQDQKTKYWSVPKKSTDLIDAEELLRYITGSWIDPFVSVRAISQFVDGSDTMLVRYGNPCDITEAIGGSRTLKKSEAIEWAVRLGGAARQLIDRKHLDTSTYKRKMDITNDGGIEMNMNLNAMNKGKWVNLISALRVYEALISSKSDEFKGTDDEDNWRYPHVKWENTLTLTCAKYLMLNLTVNAFYDKDIASDARIKETLSAGITYIYSKK